MPRPDDPWYERGPLLGDRNGSVDDNHRRRGGLGRAAATGAAGRFAAGRAAAQGLTARQAVIAAGESAIPGQLGTFGNTNCWEELESWLGWLQPILASGYAQEVDQLKQIGMEDGAKMRLLAAGTSAVVGLIEGIVPKPNQSWSGSFDPGSRGSCQAISLGSSQNGPQREMSEEYLQGVTSGLGQHIAQYLDENAQDKTVGDAFALGWEQTKEAAHCQWRFAWCTGGWCWLACLLPGRSN